MTFHFDHFAGITLDHFSQVSQTADMADQRATNLDIMTGHIIITTWIIAAAAITQF